jgi:DNA-binding transcriptional LysR family regulator
MVHMRNLDLNLLVVLDALLEHRNVSKAARALGMSQPAVSHALARLRDAFGDPLLVRTPSAMVPTPRAEGLQARLRTTLSGVDGLLTQTGPFDPALSQATLRIASNDYAGLTVLPALCGKVAALAPGIRIQMFPQREMVPAQDLASGALDLAFGVVNEDRPGLFAKRLFQESFICLVRAEHPAIKKRLTLKQYLEFDHLLISPFGGMTGTVDEALEKIGLKRRVRMSVPQFALAPWILAQTDLILTLPSRIAKAVGEGGGFRSFPPPIELGGFPFFVLWNERTASDPAHRWLRDQL